MQFVYQISLLTNQNQGAKLLSLRFLRHPKMVLKTQNMGHAIQLETPREWYK